MQGGHTNYVLFLRLQNKRNLLARKVHFFSSGVNDGDIDDLTEIMGFVESSGEDIAFCREVISMLKEVRSELRDAEKGRDIVPVITIRSSCSYERHNE